MDKYHHEQQIEKHLHLGRFLKDKYNDLLFSDVLRLLALSMISLFVPIFLIETGFSLFYVALFELGIFILMVPLHFFILKNINSWGVKRTLVISYFVNILFYISLYYHKWLISILSGEMFLLIICFLNVLAVGLYWTAHHIYFISSIKKEESGSKLGIISGIPVIASVISPFLGSLLITNFSYSASFLLSSFLLLIASFVLTFSSKIESINVDLDVDKIIDRKNKNKNIVFVIQGFGHASTGLIWPLLLFYLSVQLISIGVLYLFSNIAYALIGYFGGRKTDRDGSHRVVRIGAAGHGASMVLRAFASSFVSITAFQTMGGIFGGLLHISLDSGFFRWSRDDVANRIMNREVYMHIGRFSSIALLAFLIIWLSPVHALISVLVFSGITTFLLSLFVAKDGELVN